MFPELFHISPKTFAIAFGIFLVIYAVLAPTLKISDEGGAEGAYKDPFVAGLFLGILLIVGAYLDSGICVLIFLILEVILLVIVTISWIQAAINKTFNIVAAIVIVIEWICIYDIYSFYKAL